MSVDIEYNGSSIATIGAGQRATLSCRGKLMEGDVVISSPESDSCEVTYKGNKIADVPMGARVTIHTKGKQMEDDIVIEVVNSTLALDAPTISLEGNILTITDVSNCATEVVISVDGEAKMNIPAKVSAKAVESNTSLTASIDCCVGETIVAAIATRDTLTVSDGWTLISTSDINSVDYTAKQRLSWAYKIADSTTESITVTQASAERLYINMVALSKGATLIDKGYSYKNHTNGRTITVDKPNGLILWGLSSRLWGSIAPYDVWEASNNINIVQLGSHTQSRLGLGYDSTDETSVTFYSSANTSIIVGCLSVVGG
jgi:hypothetical protein